MQNELSLQGIVMFIYENDLNQYVSLRLRVQNAVPAQPCVGKY